jgi:hypothetical protein
VKTNAVKTFKFTSSGNLIEETVEEAKTPMTPKIKGTKDAEDTESSEEENQKKMEAL